MTVVLADPDVTLWHGDVLDTLRAMPDESVDCVVTSPPYWGLRDYGTGLWEGGNPDCDHQTARPRDESFMSSPGLTRDKPRGGDCPKCGATRQDQQLGLEATPDLFVARMVDVFREVRRVLAAHGTCWVNLGDSYNAYNGGAGPSSQLSKRQSSERPQLESGYGLRYKGLKPKDLVGIPHRVAFALQADGWYLRADIVWSKPNPMPESVTDRPTKAHEYVFLLTKQPRYWFDQEAVREPNQLADTGWVTTRSANGTLHGDGEHAQAGRGSGTARVGSIEGGRNIRSVWEIATQPYPEAHFATYPEELVRRCLLAGCPEWVCRVCGKPRERIVDKDYLSEPTYKDAGDKTTLTDGRNRNVTRMGDGVNVTTVGWSDCGHNDYRPGVVLDPFIGSGTTAHVARKHGRHAIGIDLNADYLALAAKRLQQQSLFAEGVA